jgi:hypothetical protein
MALRTGTPVTTAQDIKRWIEVKGMFRRWLWRTRDAWLPRRPPSSAAWVVYRNMQRTWFCLFTPADVLVALALLILAGALLRLQGRHGYGWLHFSFSSQVGGGGSGQFSAARTNRFWAARLERCSSGP